MLFRRVEREGAEGDVLPGDALILFLHIPKTAGITLESILSPRLYRSDEILASCFAKAPPTGSRRVGAFDRELGSIAVFNGVGAPCLLWYPEPLPSLAARYRRLPAEARARLRVVHGIHTEYGLHESLDRPASCFTLLREPVARVWSHYGMSDDPRVPEGMSLSEHIAMRVEANLQTRLLAGAAGADGPMPPEEMLRRAREHLRACTVVGLTERFDETLLLLRRAYGWRMPFYRPRNVGRKRVSREPLPAEVARRIEADNQLDAALYALARELFAEQVRAYGPGLERDLHRFRFWNSAWQRGDRLRRWLRAAARVTRQATVDAASDGLARWGGLRRLVPGRYAPRVVARVGGNGVSFDLRMGRRVVGFYDPRARRWRINPPYRLVVDEGALPGAAGRVEHGTRQGAGPGTDGGSRRA